MCAIFFLSAQFDTISNSIPIKADRNFLSSPITIASFINGEVLMLFSNSDGDTFLPPLVIMMSFFLSTIFRNSPSYSPTSPVYNQPSSVRTSLVASSFLYYPSNTPGCLTIISPSSANLTSTPGCGTPTVPSFTLSGVLPVATAEFSVIP